MNCLVLGFSDICFKFFWFFFVSFTPLFAQNHVLSAKQQIFVVFSPDLLQIPVRETFSGVFLARLDIPTQV